MSDHIDIEASPVEIVACDGCGHRNRIVYRSPASKYRCGHCKAPLPNPLEKREAKPRAAGRFWRAVKPIVVLVAGFWLSILIYWIYCLIQGATPPVESQRAELPLPTSFPLDILGKAALPGATAPPIVNGEILRPFEKLGPGKIEIDNGTHKDALVKLVSVGDDHASCIFYVSADQVAHIRDVPDGIYQVFFALGLDWSPLDMRFRESQSFGRFNDLLNFSIDYGDHGFYQYSSYSLTLHPVVGGDAKTSDIDEAQFNRY